MPWPLPEDFKAGGALRDLITAEIMQTIVGIVNHITVEEVEGLASAYIEKTAVPSAEHPWRILIPLGYGVQLDDQTPVADGTGAVGDSTKAAHGDHEHPLNVDTTDPEPVGDTADDGSAATYAKRDHVHVGAPLVPAIPASTTVPTNYWGEFAAQSGGTGSPPSTYSWIAAGDGGDGSGVALNVVERVYIDNGGASPVLYAMQRRWTFAADGRLLAVSDPYEYAISATTPV